MSGVFAFAHYALSRQQLCFFYSQEISSKKKSIFAYTPLHTMHSAVNNGVSFTAKKYLLRKKYP